MYVIWFWKFCQWHPGTQVYWPRWSLPKTGAWLGHYIQPRSWKAANFANDFLELPMTSWNHAWNTGVLAKMILNKGRGLFIISKYALEKLPICQWLPGIANDILEHRCTGQDNYKKGAWFSQYIQPRSWKAANFANDFLELPMTFWNTGVLAKMIINKMMGVA